MKISLRSLLSVVTVVAALGGSFAVKNAFGDENSWQTNFTQAKNDAASRKKSLLLDFTGSDWCPFCVKMDKEVFTQKQFSEYAAKNLVLVKLDFPRSKELSPAETAQNKELAKQYGIEGFPTYVLLDPSGKEVKRQVGYLAGGPSEFIKWASEPASASQ